ncbi:MAG TPA: hypothetical protein VFQ51_07350 [Vicinamibacteria bacterium]|nr:hypothetical protein [Vicinamibacteria bacterium]
MPKRGRPRLTQAEYLDRLQSYCRRYGVTATAAGIPPFPSGRRETDQHREWLALYRAHARLFRAPTSNPGGACPVCGQVTDAADSIAYRSATLHRGCSAIVSAVEPLGAAGFDRLRAFLWPETAARTGSLRRRKG